MRLVYSNETTEDEEEMNISQEILVLDFGDEKNEFLKSEADFGGGELLLLSRNPYLFEYFL